MRRHLLAAVVFAGFVATVYGANLALQRFGTVPVAPGLKAPAGVYLAGLALLLRDALTELSGRLVVLAAIVTGALLSYTLGAGVTLPGGRASIAVASVVAFALSEAADWAVYSPLRRRRLIAAVVASQIVGAVVDSLLFLWLAFGEVAGRVLVGQLVGKVLLAAPAAVLLFVWARRRDGRLVEVTA